MLGDRKGNTGNVNLLETVLADQTGGNISGNRYHGHAVHECRRDTGDQIGRSGTAGCQTHTDFSGGSGITVRRKGCALLVSRQNMTDPMLVMIKLLIYL